MRDDNRRGHPVQSYQWKISASKPIGYPSLKYQFNDQVKDLKKVIEDVKNVCVGCYCVKRMSKRTLLQSFHVHSLHQRLADINLECPVCKLPMNQINCADLPTALKMHQAISN